MADLSAMVGSHGRGGVGVTQMIWYLVSLGAEKQSTSSLVAGKVVFNCSHMKMLGNPPWCSGGSLGQRLSHVTSHTLSLLGFSPVVGVGRHLEALSALPQAESEVDGKNV